MSSAKIFQLSHLLLLLGGIHREHGAQGALEKSPTFYFQLLFTRSFSRLDGEKNGDQVVHYSVQVKLIRQPEAFL